MSGYDRKAMNIAAWTIRRDDQTFKATRELEAVTDPVGRAVLDLHAPIEHWDMDVCRGCPPGGEDGDDYEPWPCDTVRAVASVLGVSFPPAIGWADDPDFDPLAPIPGFPSSMRDIT